MTSRGVWIVGAGGRVKDAFLPVLAELTACFEVRGLLARSTRTLELDGRSYPVRALDDFGQGDLEQGDLIVIAVSKASVPDVLGKLTTLDVSGQDLLIDTPVVRFRLFHHWKRVLAFRNAWVAEDCATLPWLDTAREVLETGSLGSLREIHFEHSAYAYHAIASAKVLAGARRVKSGRRQQRNNEFVRSLRFPGGVVARISEPCRYAEGTFRLVGSSGVLADRARPEESGALHLEPRLSSGQVVGFRAGEIETQLDEGEARLTRGDPDGASVIQRQSAMKRVGLLRLLRAIDSGARAYAVRDGLDDMVVDYHLEKFGRYLANPFTSLDSPLARGLFQVLTRLGN